MIIVGTVHELPTIRRGIDAARVKGEAGGGNLAEAEPPDPEGERPGAEDERLGVVAVEVVDVLPEADGAEVEAQRARFTFDVGKV